MFAKLKATGNTLVISGDGRHDSMGHSAKFGAYTIFCCTLSLVIHFALVQVLFFFTILIMFVFFFKFNCPLLEDYLEMGHAIPTLSP